MITKFKEEDYSISGRRLLNLRKKITKFKKEKTDQPHSIYFDLDGLPASMNIIPQQSNKMVVIVVYTNYYINTNY